MDSQTTVFFRDLPDSSGSLLSYGIRVGSGKPGSPPGPALLATERMHLPPSPALHPLPNESWNFRDPADAICRSFRPWKLRRCHQQSVTPAAFDSLFLRSPNFLTLSLHRKVVPRSAVNPDVLDEPFHCKGLFTTDARHEQLRRFASCSDAPGGRRTRSPIGFHKSDRHCGSGRDSGSGLIGIGPAPRMRTPLFHT